MDKDKVVEIFREIVGEKAKNLSGSFFPAYANTKITNALASEFPNLNPEEYTKLDSIGMNLTCWQRDAAFIVALVLFPEKFTDKDIQEEIRSLLIHMPDHLKNALAAYNKLSEES
ncbi:MAG: hypothetical protein MJE63_05400 [Proteobacteria bacterium]|nr:hypothetical protein [Pseudomonadota bacterium]